MDKAEKARRIKAMTGRLLVGRGRRMPFGYTCAPSFSVQSLTMTKIIRERYEAGVLVSREIEGSNRLFLDLAKLGIHLVIAVSVAVIAALSAIDSLGYTQSYDPAGVSNVTCRPGVES